MNKRKIKICFFLPNLGAGGAERVISFVAENIDSKIFEPVLVIVGHRDDYSYEIKGVEIFYLNKSRVLASIPKIIGILKIIKPDIAVSTIGYLNIVMAWVSLYFSKTKFIVREVNVLSVLNQFLNKREKFATNLLTKISYQFIDHIICQSNDMAVDLAQNYSVKTKKLVVINNPITYNFKIKPDRQASNNIESPLKLITVGRLSPQKGHERIIEALKQTQIPFHYTIIGNGPDNNKIMNKINSCGLSQHVSHIKFTKDVQKYLAINDLFLQGSYVEGFPNALIESLAVGTPAIVYNAKEGINEIIQEGLNGYIAENTEEFSRLINKFYFERNKWSSILVSKTVTKKYNSSVILKKYEDLFLNVLQNG